MYPICCRASAVLLLFLFCSLMIVHAQSSKDFEGKWVGYMKVNGVPCYRLYLEFSNSQAKQVTGRLNLYDYVKTDQLAKTLAVNFDYDKQKRIAYTNTMIPSPSGSQCEGYIILKVSAASSDSLEATFRTNKDCMTPQMVISRSNYFLMYDPVFAMQKSSAGGSSSTTSTTGNTGNTPGAKQPVKPAASESHPAATSAAPASPATTIADAPVIDPHAVYIEATSLGPFINGTALVQNNRTSGIIDVSGKFVLAYGKMSLNPVPQMMGPYHRPGNTFYMSEKIDENHMSTVSLYDSRGKFVSTYNMQKAHPVFQQDGELAYVNCAYNYHTIEGKIVKDFICYTDNGQKFALKSLHQDCEWSEGLSAFYTEDKLERKSYGYMNPQGQTIIAQKYKDAMPFSEGLACVAVADETGAFKYGFIDNKGNTVIPFMYSNRPGNFHNGQALVYPKETDDFVAALINKKGDVVTKLTKDMYAGTLRRADDIHEGYVSGIDKLMDATGHIYTLEDICRMTGMNKGEINSVDLMHCSKGEMLVSGRNTKGLVDIEAGFSIPSMYSELSYFDPISHLAHARWVKWDAAAQKTKVVDGYINEKNVFVIVMGAGSKW